MSQPPVVNPPIPYFGSLRLVDHQTIVVQGKAPHHATGFSVNFTTAPATDFKDTPLHFNPRFNERCVVRNSLQYGNWGSEERSGGLPFQKGVPFELAFHIHHSEYKITVNGNHFCHFRHRMPKDQVQYLVIKGDVEVSFIKVDAGPSAYIPPGGTYMSPGGIQPPPYTTGGYPVGNQPPPFQGSPMHHAQGFTRPTIGFQTHEAGGFPQPSGGYPPSGYPQAGAPPPMFNPTSSRTKTDCDHSHTTALGALHLPSKFASAFVHDVGNIFGNIKSSFTSSSSSSVSFTKTLGPQSVPLTTGIPGSLSPGRMIHISGIPHSNPSRMTFNLLSGVDKALHFDVRFNYGDSRNATVRTHCQNGTYGPEERDQSYFPFMPNANFDMILLVEPSCFKIAVNNQHFVQFNHRLPFQGISTLNIEGDVRLTQIRFQ